MKNYELFLPFILIILMIGSSIPYLIKGQLWMAVYWICAGFLNFSIIMANKGN